MNDSPQFDADRRASTALGLRYGRIAGHVLTLLLLALGLSALIKGSGTFEAFKGVYFITYSIVISLPFTRLSDKSWRLGFGLLVGLSALFVFVMVVVVIFAYMASDARGERLGVPGFEGTLIFLALLQVPVVLFQRKPDMLD
jgi:hypothetical protein|tara:strand:- start:2167 stop:2592 length:426 start_codon:yes stop_codon:yes gene_type:complete